MISSAFSESVKRGFGRAGPLVFVWAITVIGLAVGVIWLQLGYDGSEPNQRVSSVSAADSSDIRSPKDARETPEVDLRRSLASDTAKNDPVNPSPSDDAEPATGSVRKGPDAVIQLTPAPDPALVEETPAGALPVISEDGRYPWRVYARPYLGRKSAKHIAIVVQEIGLSDDVSRVAITQLPAEVTLAVSPYARDPQAVAQAARGAGHEVLLMVPMEPIAYPDNDPGPHTLLTRLSPVDNLARLHHVMSRFQGYVGLVNHMGSRFTATQNPLVPILEEVDRRGLLFVDARSTGKSLVPALAGEIGLPVVENDRYIDNEITELEIDRYLAELEAIAIRKGHAVGFARPYPLTIRRILAWRDKLAIKNIDLVPVSALAR